MPSKYADLPQSPASDFNAFSKEQPQKNKGPNAAKDKMIDKIETRKKIDSLLDGIIPQSNSYTDARKSYEASRKRGGEIVRMMKFPGPTGPGRAILDDINNLPINVRSKRTIRSRPTVGRTIELDPSKGVDFGRASRLLNGLCAQNKIRGDLMSQRFHERPGLKRKRLKQQRWRRFFKAGFVATVERVKEMRRKGW